MITVSKGVIEKNTKEYFRKVEETYFLHIYSFLELYASLMREGKKSIPIAKFREFGILIEQTKKVSRYRYDIDSFMKPF